MPVPIVPHQTLPDDWEMLPFWTRHHFGLLMKVLQANPYHPELLPRCQQESQERYAFELAGGYVVYWKVECKDEDEAIALGLSKNRLLVKLLSLEKK